MDNKINIALAREIDIDGVTLFIDHVDIDIVNGKPILNVDYYFGDVDGLLEINLVTREMVWPK